MSAFKQKLARLGATVGVLAATTTAIMAVGGVSASSAFGAECNPKGLNIYGQGASLQKIGQEQWSGRVAATVEGTGEVHKALEPATGFAAECPEGPTVSYNSVGSGAGLKTFRYTGEGAIKTEYAWAASDDGPSKKQIEHAEEATEGGVAAGANAIIIPQIETSIAVIYNLPENCSLTFNSTHGITGAQLNEVFGGEKIKTWNGLTKASPTGAGCANEFERVVRSDGSGTTFQFKNYLAVDGGPAMPCKLTGWEEPAEKEVKETTLWANMKSNEPTSVGVPNTTWPQKSTCPGEPTTLTAVATGKGNSGVVEYVSTHPGTIGYAVLPDMLSSANKEGKAKFAFLQNASAEVGTYAGPEGAEEQSACGERQYEVPVPGRAGESGESVDWSHVFGAKPTVGGKNYPLCTITYGLSWSSYEKAKFGGESENKKNAVVSYEKYVLGAGQNVKHGYQPLPHPAEAKFNVLAAAELALSKVGK